MGEKMYAPLATGTPWLDTVRVRDRVRDRDRDRVRVRVRVRVRARVSYPNLDMLPPLLS